MRGIPESTVSMDLVRFHCLVPNQRLNWKQVCMICAFFCFYSTTPFVLSFWYSFWWFTVISMRYVYNRPKFCPTQQRICHTYFSFQSFSRIRSLRESPPFRRGFIGSDLKGRTRHIKMRMKTPVKNPADWCNKFWWPDEHPLACISRQTVINVDMGRYCRIPHVTQVDT